MYSSCLRWVTSMDTLQISWHGYVFACTSPSPSFVSWPREILPFATLSPSASLYHYIVKSNSKRDWLKDSKSQISSHKIYRKYRCHHLFMCVSLVTSCTFSFRKWTVNQYESINYIYYFIRANWCLSTTRWCVALPGSWEGADMNVMWRKMSCGPRAQDFQAQRWGLG